MFLVIGTRYIVSGNEPTSLPRYCAQCGSSVPFIRRSGRNFLTLFFLIPILPMGAKKTLLECPNCQARYEETPSPV